jgi:Carboxypeptidase regulatory-like domain
MSKAGRAAVRVAHRSTFWRQRLWPGSKLRTSVTGRFSKVGTAVALLIAVGALYANAPKLNALDEPTTLGGTVRDGRGVPQPGATVELLRPDTSLVLTVFTDEYGRFLLTHIVPGTYSLKATGTLFLPTLRENLEVLAHRRTSVNLTLSTVMEAFQWLPAKRRSVDEPDDEWAWTLRSAANRPLLRMLEDGPLVVVSDMDSAPVLKARVILRGGANEFGEGGLHNAFEIERSKQDDRRLILRADIGSSDVASVASAETLVGYERQLTLGTTIRTVAAMQDLPGIEQTSGQQGIQSLVLRSAQSIELTTFLTAELGNEFEAVRGNSDQFANHPFGTVTWRAGDNAVSYHLATARNAQVGSELDQSTSAIPTVTEVDGALRIERGLHQKVQVEHTGDKTRYEVAIYRDRIANTVVNGGGDISAADLNSGYVIYDPVTELLNVEGASYTTKGVVGDIKTRVHGETWLTLGFADGDALTIPAFALPSSLESGLTTMKPRHTQMYSVAMSGHIMQTGTHWQASYRWQPEDTITAVAPYDVASPDAYLSLLLRQPLRCWHLLPNGVEALVDVRNLLAEGYRPFITTDGSTLYFAQAERSIRGGVSFTF